MDLRKRYGEMYDETFGKKPTHTSALSALPPPEPQGACERSSLATGSLPVSSAELLEWLRSRIALCEQDERAAHANHEYHRAQEQRTTAYTYWNVVGFVQRKTDAARATERQPEENVASEPRR